MIDLSIDSSPVDAAVAQFKKSYMHNASNNAKLYGKHMAQQAYRYTLPPNKKGSYWNVDAQKRRIAEDNVVMYPEWSDDNWASRAFDLIRDESSDAVARKWWGDYKADKHGSEVTIDSDGIASVSTGQDFRRSTQKASRLIKSKKANDKRYQMRRSKVSPAMFKSNAAPIAMLTNKRAAATKRRQRLAGLAKASWRQAAQDYGGQQTYTRGRSKITWPRQIKVPLTAVGKKVGRGSYKVTDKAIYIRVSSSINYMDEALPMKNRGKAIRMSKKTMQRLLERNLREAIGASFGKQRKSRGKRGGMAAKGRGNRAAA